jgi:hypothetical protein
MYRVLMALLHQQRPAGILGFTLSQERAMIKLSHGYRWASPPPEILLRVWELLVSCTLD